MVLKRKLNSVFDFVNIPKAPRSSRRKVSNQRANDDDSEIRAIDLLASLAGKLLEESESSSSTYASKGDNQDHSGVQIKREPCKSEFSDQGNPSPKPTCENTSETCLQFPSLETKMAGIADETGLVTVDTGFEEGEEADGIIVDTLSVEDPSRLHSQFPESVHLDGGLNLPPGADGLPNGSFQGYENRSKLVCRDDDENYCKYYSEKCKSFRPIACVGNRRSKKISAMTKYGRPDGCLKSLYRKRKVCYGYNLWKHETVHRKRRLSDKGFVVYSDEDLGNGSVSNSPQKGESGNDVFSTAIGLHSKESRVKFSIKSLRIPELLIEVPKTATVGSVKRTVKEAVTALLGGGIRIGVLLQGKKLRDDNTTLSQIGLSCRENISNLGFTLEPASEKLPLPLSSENPVVSTSTDSTNFSDRSVAGSPELDSRILLPLQDAEHLIHSGDSVEKNHELVPYQSDLSADEQPSPDSRALVPVSALEAEALAIVPVNEKPKRTELSQRRTRRPFCVTEVEDLVQAVEELGTGRWRDVKLRSFENASHRTYVDLKDKWKTLVHTASIAPQQRRGQPVPQVLLDRVLEAHKYWSQHQVKHNGKPQVATTMVVQSVSSM